MLTLFHYLAATVPAELVGGFAGAALIAVWAYFDAEETEEDIG